MADNVPIRPGYSWALDIEVEDDTPGTTFPEGATFRAQARVKPGTLASLFTLTTEDGELLPVNGKLKLTVPAAKTAALSPGSSNSTSCAPTWRSRFI